MMPNFPRLPANERLRRAGVGAWAIIGILILAAAALWVLLKIRIIFPPLVLALLFIYLLNPVVIRLERKGLGRGLAVGVSYLGLIAIVALLVILVAPLVSNQVSQFATRSPTLRFETVEFVEKTAQSIDRRFGLEVNTTQIECLLGANESQTRELDAPTEARCDEVTQDLRERLAHQAGRITTIAGSVFEVLLIFVLGPLLALYLLIDLPHVQRDALRLVPAAHREEVADLGSKVGDAIGGFFRGQLLVAIIVGVLSAIGFKLIGLPFWLLIGAIAGFFNLVPLIGPYIGGFLGFLVGTATGGIRLGLYAIGVEFAVQFIDNHFISPSVMRRAINLHPVAVMLSILAGGTLAGFWGVLLGVPAVAVGKLLFGHLWATRVLGEEVSPHGGPSKQGVEAPSVVPEGEPSPGSDDPVGSPDDPLPATTGTDRTEEGPS